MPLLRNGQWEATDDWQITSQDEAREAKAGGIVLDLASYRSAFDSRQADASGHTRWQATSTGVLLEPADNPLDLQPCLDQLPLVCLSFPAFTDGRGYSHARTLRKRLGYTGELRAIGDIRADQLLFMMRVGINAFSFDEAPDTALIQRLIAQYSNNYQPSYPLPAAG